MLVLLSTLVASIGVLMPQPTTVLGLELLAISLWGLLFPITLLSKAIKIPGSRRGGFSIRRAGVFLAAYLVGFIGAAAVVTCCEWGYVWRACVLHDPARHLDMERLDDHAGHWAERKSPEIIYALRALGQKRTLVPHKRKSALGQRRNLAARTGEARERFQTPPKKVRFAF